MSLEQDILTALNANECGESLARELLAEVIADWQRRILKAKRELACADLFGYYQVSRRQLAEDTGCHRSTVYRTRRELVASPPLIATSA